MDSSTQKAWDGVERRNPSNSRRRNSERRNLQERRNDRRTGSSNKRTFAQWLRSLVHTRLGVDRRKGGDQRIRDRRSNSLRSLLTKDELDALLK